jgi:hypothetical protein
MNNGLVNAIPKLIRKLKTRCSNALAIKNAHGSVDIGGTTSNPVT